MVGDANKGITSITYNHLNLPVNITVTGVNSGTLNYIYDATGIKLRKANSNGTTTDYMGNFVYENGSLKQISHAEGYVEPNGNGWQYVYRLTDIWGNTRITFADDNNDGSVNSSEIRREQNYYPGGLEHKGYNSSIYGVKNNLKTYQKQEFTEDLELNTHEWLFRISDPATLRFWQVDPLSENYYYNSTYAFQENKLGMGVELEGRELDPWSLTRAAQDPEADKFQEENPKTALAIVGTYVLSPLVVFFGLETTIAFVANEVKDEALSQATGGASDVLDLTKAGTKVVKEGVKAFTEKSLKNSSKFEDITKSSRGKKSTKNIKTDVTKTEFEKNLEESGFEKTTSKDGNATILTKDGKSFTLRKSSNGINTADFRNNSSSKDADTKYRLENEKSKKQEQGNN